MSETESQLQARIRLAVGKVRSARLFRNNVGEGWHGKVIDHTANTLTLARPTRIVYGLCEGSSDLVGPVQVVVTPEMVGTTVAVFSVGEVKRPGEKVPAHQQNFIDFVRDFGGYADVIRSPEDALRLVRAK